MPYAIMVGKKPGNMDKMKFNLFIAAIILLLTSCITHYKSSDLFSNKTSQELFKVAQDFQNKGQLDSALVWFNKADAAAPNTALIIHERGLLKSNMQKYDEGIADIKRSIELTTDERQRQVRRCNLGVTYAQMGKTKEACEEWRAVGKMGKSYIDQYCK